MRMSIEEIIENLTTIRNKLCSRKYETESTLTFDGAINTMRKYQNIETIIEMWKEDRKRFTLGDNGSKDEYLRQISEVLEGDKI